MIQSELKMVKEFRKKRAEMQHEIEQLQDTVSETRQGYKDSLTTMEHKFFEEKLRLQKEANRRIAELAGKAHEEAVK